MASLPRARFSILAGGIIQDSLTDLEWFVGPDQKTTWDAAYTWVSSLSVGGGGWRMPTKKELASLYIKGAGRRNLDPAFRLAGWWVWSSEIRNKRTVWEFHFGRGLAGWKPRNNSNGRAMAVRGQSRIILQPPKQAPCFIGLSEEMI